MAKRKLMLAAHSPEARKKAAETMKRNREAKLAAGGKTTDIPLSVIPSREDMKRRTYTDEFKRMAVKLAAEIGRNAASEKLGISDSLVSSWKTRIDAGLPLTTVKSKSGTSTASDGAAELARLKQEMHRWQEERNLRLERAAVIVAFEGDRGTKLAEEIRKMKSNVE